MDKIWLNPEMSPADKAYDLALWWHSPGAGSFGLAAAIQEALETELKAERERCLAICERVFKDPPKGIVSEATITAHLTAIRRVTREINDGPLK